MFQYAAGFALADRLGVDLKLDLSEFETYFLRRYELGRFNINSQIATSDESSGIVINPSRSQRIYSRLGYYFGFDLHKIAFKENEFRYNKTFEKLKHPVYLNGYWQSERYFHSAERKLRNEFTLNDNLSEESQRILEEILQCSAVSVHIRRGDYVTNPSAASIHGVCALEYYYSAIRFISTHVKNPVFFVFSDDPHWAKDNLNIGQSIRIIEANGPDRGVEDMWLMKSCRHHIVANSSFSWWAAWLNDSTEKIVIAPKVWFLDTGIDTRDLVPATWHRI